MCTVLSDLHYWKLLNREMRIEFKVKERFEIGVDTTWHAFKEVFPCLSDVNQEDWDMLNVAIEKLGHRMIDEENMIAPTCATFDGDGDIECIVDTFVQLFKEKSPHES